MVALVDAVPTHALAKKTLAERRLVYHYVRTLVSASQPDAYAAACLAIAHAKDPDYSAIRVPTLIIGGAEDPLSSPAVIDSLVEAISQSRKVMLPDVGHWHCLEDPEAVARAILAFL